MPNIGGPSKVPDKKDDEPKAKKEAPKEVPVSDRPGNVKLIGIAGMVKGEEWTVELGSTIVVGRSSECDVCLRTVPRAINLADDHPELEKHFRTVSRRHMRLSHDATDLVVVEDLSSNGLFIDGERVSGTQEIKDLAEVPRELRLGLTETFALEWRPLVPKSSVKMVQVAVKKAAPSEEAAEGEPTEKAEEQESS